LPPCHRLSYARKAKKLTGFLPYGKWVASLLPFLAKQPIGKGCCAREMQWKRFSIAFPSFACGKGNAIGKERGKGNDKGKEENYVI